MQSFDTNTLVRNPCVGICCLDESDLCIACKRSGIEIAEWGMYDSSEKKAVLAKIEQRYLEEESKY
ncbi:MAG: DUF1289 domain-containing protein [Oceanospirillaceae bacterium]|nr:DUF1289 domain-containing protein [Oceanospirillaceae bacterium]